MWTAITSAISGIFTGWVDYRKAKYKAQEAREMALAQIEADWDIEALRQAQYSWKDELITIIIFAPLVVAWFDESKAKAWVAFVGAMPVWYQIIMAGIVAASFGLRWFFKSKFANGFKAKTGDN